MDEDDDAGPGHLAAQDDAAAEPNHVVHVGPGGSYGVSGGHSSSHDDVVAIGRRIVEASAGHVVLHFHGGLVGEAAGLRVARTLGPVYQSGGAYPIIVVWDTSVLRTVRENLDEIHQTKLFRKLVLYALRHAAKRIGLEVPGRSVAGEQLSLDEAQWLWDHPDSGIRVEPAARSLGGGETVEELEAMEPALLAEIQGEVHLDISGDVELAEIQSQGPGTPLASVDGDEDGGRGISLLQIAQIVAVVVFRTAKRYVGDRDHGFVATVIEEVLRKLYVADAAAWLWGGMKAKAQGMFAAPSGGADTPDRVGTHLLAVLAEAQAEVGFRLHLVGHSAGSIAICHLLDARRDGQPNLVVDSVALMAPAVRADVFGRQLEAGDLPRLRVFTMDDDTERQDALAGPAYPHSLLYFISGCLEGEADTELVGLERHLTGVRPYDSPPALSVGTYLRAAERGRLVLSPSADGAADGFAARSLRHGDFDEDAFMQASLVAWVAASD